MSRSPLTHGLSTNTPGGTKGGKLEIMVPASQSIALNTVIVLEVVNYAPTSTLPLRAK